MFEDLLAQVLEARKSDWAEGTFQLQRYRGESLLRHFRGWRVSAINAYAIRDWQRKRAADVVGSTLNKEAALLQLVLQEAKTWAAIEPDYKRQKERTSQVGRVIEDFSLEQERLLLDTAKTRPGWDAAFYASLLASNTTMRGVEIKNLRLRDVDLIDREVIVRRSKTDAGLRRIPLNDAARWALGRLLERAAGLGSTQPEHFLLPAFLYRSKLPNRGTGYDPNRHQKGWRSAWRALTREAARSAGRAAAEQVLATGKGLRAAIAAWRRAAAPFRRLRFHDLRHLAITKFAESDASDSTIMAISGHLSRSMMEHYSHVRAEAKRKAIDALPSYIPTDKTPATATTKRIQ